MFYQFPYDLLQGGITKSVLRTERNDILPLQLGFSLLQRPSAHLIVRTPSIT